MALNLRDFLAALGNDLIRIKDEIEPVTQAGALCSAAPRPILFENLRGFPDFKLCDILVKDRARQALALGTDPRSVVRELADRMFTRVPSTRMRVVSSLCCGGGTGATGSAAQSLPKPRQVTPTNPQNLMWFIILPAKLYQPTGSPLFCSSSHFCRGAK